MSHEERQEKKAELKYKKNPTCFDRVPAREEGEVDVRGNTLSVVGSSVPYILTTYTFHKTVDDRRGITCAINISYRFNCQPGETAEENACHILGCCYDTVKGSDLYAPTCFHSIPSEYGYIINNTQDTVAPRYNPLVYRLESKEELSLNITPLMEKTNFNTTAWSLQAKVQRQGNDVVRILLWCPENNTHFNDDFKPESGNDYKLDVIIEEKEGDFNITVVRVATNETLMETVFGPLIYGEKYMEITTRLPTYHLYGLGQRYNYELIPNFKQRESWALFNREEDIKSGATYGSHPFYMNFEKSGNMFGVYLKNSAPVEVGVVPVPGVVFRGVGGVLDFRIMAGPKPIDVTEQYTKMVGRPTLPPRWSLGYHLCRTTLNQTEYNNTVEVMKEAKIPYESDCIDARLSYPDSFASLPAKEKEKVDEMKLSGRKFFMVQYPFVRVGSQTYNETKDLHVFMKLNATMDYFGSVNKTTMVYPDYVDNNTIHKWMDNNLNITNLYNLTDGILLLRNSPLNDVQLNYHAWDVSGGPNCTASTPENCCPSAHLNFHPGGLTDINNGTLCWEALHPTMMSSPHLELHNAYGRYHHMRVHEVMK
ncbi:sucrase-isomaltase, intestinal-like, partial [Homarus americanus]|uniref:sucrase-isomaltase, intestinal-like n=1 Tax=Homarus americanus TaxID=6706 RepID=UPI001C437DCF